VLIEGTQGFGLSLLHSGMFPYTTSRDTSAAAFVSEAGLSPLDVDEVIMVIRSYPIRVGGNSGPLVSEINWDSVTKLAGSEKSLIEYTSVTKKIRRVGHFNPEIVRKAIEVNNPNRIVLNHVDYIDASCRNGHLSEKAHQRIKEIEQLIGRRIDFLGFDRADLYPNLAPVGLCQSNSKEVDISHGR
jgi:adenylosuccinate synthase